MTDPVTQYAKDVVDGRAIANRLVRLACVRHLRDLEQQADKGLVWKPGKAQRAVDFFAEVLYLPENTNASDEVSIEVSTEPQPFVLAPWQAFIVGSVFGWYTAAGHRRFREAYIETAKGSGKTPLGAGMMIYMLVADGERGAQVYLAAVTRDQAGLAWRDCRAMVDASPELKELFGASGFLAHELKIPDEGSFLKPVSSEKRGLDGKRVHGALVDELHEHATPIVVNKMRAGTKGRRNALIVKTTNSGFDRTSVCWAHHEYSRKVLDGTVQNETWFAYVCGLDPCDACQARGKWFPSDDCETGECDDWKTEGQHWLKACPNRGISLPWQYVRERVEQAKGMPSEVSDVLRFNFCVWTQGASRAIDMGKWAACQPMPAEDELLSADCFGCLDLGESDDLTAWGRLWVLDDGRVAVKMRYFIPSDAIQRFPSRPYEQWKRADILTVIPDAEVTDYEVVRQAIRDDYKALGMQGVFYDTKSARETAQILTGEGVEMVAMTQGFPLNEGIKRMLELIVSGRLCHGNDPILSWMASNTVVITQGDKRRLAKDRSPEKIDGIAALVMGIEGAIVRRERKPDPSYQFMVFGGAR
jgi:phage terminase large subunit-like protein